MKTVAENYAMGFQESDRSGDGPLDDVVMGKIGEDLRDFYSDMMESEQPQALLVLAEALETRLSGDGFDS